MDHTPQNTGNSRLDGVYLVILASATFISKITMSNVVTGITLIGAVLYVANQGIQLYNNLKKKKNDRVS